MRIKPFKLFDGISGTHVPHAENFQYTVGTLKNILTCIVGRAESLEAQPNGLFCEKVRKLISFRHFRLKAALSDN